MVKKTKETNPIIRKNLSIGAEDAEMDNDFLQECFIETEDVNLLLDTTKPQRIIIGRTGAGKTALLKHLKKHSDNVIQLSPENLSFRYLADSSILNFFEEAGVNLNIFYLLLWRHIFCTELIQKKYNICNEQKMKQFINRFVASLSGDKGRILALEYLQEWGEKFWITTQERIVETTQKLETDFEAHASGEIIKLLNLGAKGAQKLTEEQKYEAANIGKNVVNKIQVEKLTQVINILNSEIFNDPKERYYILIDQLDENWASEELKYKIIRALIDTTKKFQRVTNVKIIIALREDLLLKVLSETRDSGYQEDKMESLFLRLHWLPEELENILDKRVETLFKRQYDKKQVKASDILPSGQRDKHDAVGYIIDRSFLRPREVISFFNCCLEHSAGQTHINYKTISDAELAYSRKRIRALGDEWANDFPLLENYVNLLHGLPSSFTFSTLMQLPYIEDILLDIACYDSKRCEKDKICKITKPYLEGNKQKKRSIILEIVCAFYQVGLLGVKLDETYPTEWSYNSTPLLQPTQIKDKTKLYIHPTFYRALGVNIKAAA
tara:strand:+ start:879 stop:2540 length:1662 start_codon:yes stop_codon:yes gene_type:complete